MIGKKKLNQTELVIIIAIVALGALALGSRYRQTVDGEEGGGGLFGLPDLILNIIIPEGDGAGEGDGDGGDGAPPPPAPENSRKPTGLTITLTTHEMDMGSWIRGTVSGDGYNYPIEVWAKHTGSGDTGNLYAFLGSDGKYTSEFQKMETPGVWELYAEADGIKSEPVTLVVRGIRVVCERGHYSKTLSDSILIGVYSHHTRQNAGIVGHYPEGAYSRSITNTVINSGGYGSVSPNLDGLANGDWEIDAVIGSDQARDYEATYWVSIGR